MQNTQMALLVVAMFASAAAFDLQGKSLSSLTFDATDDEKPIAKVIALLKDMQKQLELEGEEDEEAYEKMACWCVTNDNEKTKSIGIAKTRIEDLTSSIEELTGKSAQLNTEIPNLEKEVAKAQQALDTATSMRQKELAEFVAEEKDVLQSLSALKSAIAVLSKHNTLLQSKKRGASMLQVSQGQTESEKAEMLVVTSALERGLNHTGLLQGVLTHTQKRKAASFIKAAAPGASGEIFGIMNAMKESFESNLAKSTKEENQGIEEYQSLKAAKEEEIAASNEQIEAKTQELATADQKLADDKQDLVDTTNSLASDEEFLANLKEECAMVDAEWEQRQKDRNIELEGVAKALEILTSDDAHDLFSKTMGLVQADGMSGKGSQWAQEAHEALALARGEDAHKKLVKGMGFMQESSTVHSTRRDQASKVLQKIALKHNNPKLMAIATQVRLDAFVKVKKAIDDMVAQLTQEKKDEIKHRDYCIENLNENGNNIERRDRDKVDTLNLIDELTQTIGDLTKAIDTLKSEITEMTLQLKRAGEDRELENKEFNTVVADQRATIKLLQSVHKVLAAIYKKAALLQAQKPAGFKEHKKNASGGGVVGMIEQIIKDSQKLETEAIHSEEDAQKAYEDFVLDSNKSIEEKSKDIINKSDEKATAEKDLTDAIEVRDNLLQELEMLSNESADLHKACDFVVKNFDIRQTARGEEIEALKQAKSILSGAKFSQFLQTLQ
jgi:hypothetical protein